MNAKPPSAYRAAPRTFVSSAPSCPRCDKSVYAAEQVLGPGGREYHKRCLTCISCKKAVGPGAFEEHEGDPYCKHCYGKNFGPKGYGHGGAMTGEYHDPLLNRSPFSSPARSSSVRNSLSSVPPPASPTSRPSSEMPGVSKPGRVDDWDAEPLRTSVGGKTSIESPMNVYQRSRMQDLENDQEDRGQEEEQQAPQERTNSPIARPYRPSSPTKPSSRPTSPLKPSYPHRPDSPASSVGTSASASASVTTSTSLSSSFQADPPRPPSSTSNSAGGLAGYKSNLGLLGSSGPDMCRRCGTVVYFAEKVVAGGHKWHKRCLRCVTCSKALDSHLVEKDNLPYCKKCYDQAWGLKSQGFVLRPGLH